MFPIQLTIRSLEEFQRVQALFFEPPAAATEPSAVTTSAVAPVPAASYDDAKNAIVTLAQSKGRDAAAAVLATFAGATALKSIAPDAYGDVVARCQEAGL